MKPKNPKLRERLPYLEDAREALARTMNVGAVASLSNNQMRIMPITDRERMVAHQLGQALGHHISRKLERREGFSFPLPSDMLMELRHDYRLDVRVMQEEEYSYLCKLLNTLINDAEEMEP